MLRQIRHSLPWLVLSAVLAPAWTAAQGATDEWLKKPVDDRTFATYRDFFTYNRQLPFDARTITVEEHEGIKREHLSFQSTPGMRVFAHLYQPTAAPLGAALIMLHGGAPAGKNSVAVPARALAQSGWTVLAIDMWHYGERKTELLTTFTSADRHDRLYNDPPVYLNFVIQTVKDVARSFDYLVQERGINAKRVGLFGLSRGAILGTIAAGVDQRISPVVLGIGGHFDVSERAHLPAACPANFIGRISPRPLLMLNGLFDQTMDKTTSVDPLYALAKQPKQILWSERGHQPPSEENSAAMLRWLKENLK